MRKRTWAIQEELPCLSAYELKPIFNTLTEIGQSLTQTVTIHNMKNNLSMDVTINATLTDTKKMLLNVSWLDNNQQYNQTININKRIDDFLLYCGIKNHYYFVGHNNQQCKKMFYHEYQFKGRKDFKCRLEHRNDTKEQRMMRLLQNPPKHNGSKMVKAINGKLTKYGRAEERYQINLNEFLMQMYDLSSSGQRAQLNKFIEWSETLKKSINKMQ